MKPIIRTNELRNHRNDKVELKEETFEEHKKHCGCCEDKLQRRKE